jgi:hypothetical protein
MNANVIIIERGKPTPQYISQWRQRGQTSPTPVLALPINLTLINPDRTPTTTFSRMYKAAWGQDLPPQLPICEPDGRPTPEHLKLWA